jgi:hypothetical protein
MSLNALTEQELRRRSNRTRGGRQQSGAVVPESAGAAADAGDGRVGNALAALIGYIPTEVITLYVAALSAQQAVLDATGFFDARWTLWCFTALTPALLLLIYLSKVAAGGGSLPGPRAWPWWKMCAASIAFIVWALAVPGNPYLTGTASAVAGLGAMLTSSLLHLVTPIFERPAPGTADAGT